MRQEPANRPSQEFIDKHMISNVEGAMIYAYVQRTPGPVPSAEQLKAFVSSLSQQDILSIVRGHPGLKSLQANMRQDADVLRWARALT